MTGREAKAVILPHDKKLIIWVQSPNGFWMLLSGHWSVASDARRYCRAAGYILTDQRSALAQIEKQMEERANELNSPPVAIDITRIH